MEGNVTNAERRGKQMKDFFKSKKGITLVALVITIVVLIILAGVIISITLGNGGIINRAKTAKEQYANAQDYEQTQIAKTANEIDKYVGGNRLNGVNGKLYKLGTYEATTVNPGDNLDTTMINANTMQINIAEKYNNYKQLTKNSFLIVDTCNWSTAGVINDYVVCRNYSTQINEYDSNTGLLTIVKPFGYRDGANNSNDYSYGGSVTIYIIDNLEIIDL